MSSSSSSSSTRRRVVFLMTRPDQGLSLLRAYTNGIAWIDGMGGDQKSSVRFGSLHFTSPIPRFLMMIIIIIMMTKMMHSSCWLVPRTFLFSSRVVRLGSSVEMMNEGRVARKLRQQTDGQASLLLDRACRRVVMLVRTPPHHC